MLETLARYWWAVVLRGVAAVVFGLMAIVWPDITLWVLVLLFGAYAIVDGIVAFATAALGGGAAAGRRGWLIVEGIVGVLAGVLTFIWPSITTLVLLFVIAAWAVVTGVLEIFAAIRLRREIEGEWLLVVSGVLSVLFGLLLVVWPTTGALALVLLIGIYAIAFGIALVMLGIRLRQRRRPDTVPDASRPTPA